MKNFVAGLFLGAIMLVFGMLGYFLGGALLRTAKRRWDSECGDIKQ
jgi:hypothetical protein